MLNVNHTHTHETLIEIYENLQDVSIQHKQTHSHAIKCSTILRDWEGFLRHLTLKIEKQFKQIDFDVVITENKASL